jgi:DNA-binding MarR family transcriptional regulator
VQSETSANQPDNSNQSVQAAAIDALLETLMQAVTQVKRAEPTAQGGLRRVQFAAIVTLLLQGPRRITTLADDLAIDLGVLSRQVTDLVERGMVHRQRDPQDGRAWLVEVTDHGRQTILAIRQAQRERFARALADFPAEQLRATAEVVQAIINGLTVKTCHISNQQVRD